MGPLWGLLVALVFPIGYGIYDLIQRKKTNFLSILGFISVLCSGGLALAQVGGFWFAVKDALLPTIIGVAVLLVAVVAAGAWRLRDNRLTAQGSVLRVGLVQGNIGQTQKWDPAYRDAIINRYLGLSRQAIAGGADVVVWPMVCAFVFTMKKIF